jgi:hypothetical protein
VTTAPRAEKSSRYTPPVVAHGNAKPGWGILKFNLDPASLGMSERIEQCLTCNPVRFLFDYRM